jgi:hypothetical protein
MMCGAQSAGGEGMHRGVGVWFAAASMMGSVVVAVVVGLGVFEGIGLGVGVYVAVMALSTIRVTLTSSVISTTLVTSN